MDVFTVSANDLVTYIKEKEKELNLLKPKKTKDNLSIGILILQYLPIYFKYLLLWNKFV